MLRQPGATVLERTLHVPSHRALGQVHLLGNTVRVALQQHTEREGSGGLPGQFAQRPAQHLDAENPRVGGSIPPLATILTTLIR
jgi:hypothetical protein